MSYTVSILEYYIEKKNLNNNSILSRLFIASNNNPRSDALLNLPDFLQGDKNNGREASQRAEQTPGWLGVLLLICGRYDSWLSGMSRGCGMEYTLIDHPQVPPYVNSSLVSTK